VRSEVAKLSTELGELRADLSITRSILDGKIVELKGKADAA